jgi:hypothetical protein
VTEHGDTIRLVPKEADPLEETLAVAEEHDWEDQELGDDEPQEWHVPDPDATVRWVNDAETGVMFFEIEGPGRTSVAKQLEDAIPMLGVDDLEDVLERRASDRPSLRRGLYIVATAAPAKADKRVMALLTRYFGDDDPVVRRTAMIAASITGWPEFREPVSKLVDDPDEDVRDVAESTLRALDRAS